MNQCIKCGRQIPEGELFCVECGLNPGSSLFEEPKPAPVGKMQTPKPRKPAVQPAPVAVKERKTKSKKKNTGLKAAFAFVTILLLLVVGLVAWEYTDIKVERTRLETKEADLLLREKEKEDLQAQIADLELQLGTLNVIIEEKDTQIKELNSQLTGAQSNQSQSWYDLTTAQAEVARLEEENQQLLLLEDELEMQVNELKAKLSPAEEKAQFLDKYVVFANNDGSYFYHTYDCEKFTRRDFWAYSRKLAENQGFSPCPTCGGKVQ